MRAPKPGPRVNLGGSDRRRTRPPSRNGRERGGHQPTGENLDRVTEAHLDLSAHRQIRQALCDEHEPLAREAEALQQRAVEYEHHRKVRMGTQRRIGITERLCRDPHGFGRLVADRFRRASRRRWIRVGSQ